MRIWWTNPRLSMDDVKKKKERSVVPKLAKEKKKPIQHCQKDVLCIKE